MRYLGGGIGHLEQFPPANNDDEFTYEYEDNDDDGIRDTNKDGGSENDEDDEDSEVGESGEYPDPGESSDEDVGNVY